MTTLVEFLRARLDEDEAAAGRLDGAYIEGEPSPVPAWALGVLADVAAKRRILALHGQVECVNCEDAGRTPGTSCHICHHDEDTIPTEPKGLYDGTCFTIRALATVYADHPDYDEAWRP